MKVLSDLKAGFRLVIGFFAACFSGVLIGLGCFGLSYADSAARAALIVAGSVCFVFATVIEIGNASKVLSNAYDILSKYSDNDYTDTMNKGYKGFYGQLANSANLLNQRLLHIQEAIVMIANGDESQLENLKKTGKRSEKDQLVPAFISLIETIQNLNSEVDFLTKEAVNGNLNVRGG